MKRKLVFESFKSFAEYLDKIIKNQARRNVPDKLKDVMDHLAGKSFADLLEGATATGIIEPDTLQSTCDAIGRLLVHETAPLCKKFTVKRDFGNNKGRNIFCVVEYETPFPDEIKRMENSIIRLFENKYDLKLRFGSLTKE